MAIAHLTKVISLLVVVASSSSISEVHMLKLSADQAALKNAERFKQAYVSIRDNFDLTKCELERDEQKVEIERLKGELMSAHEIRHEIRRDTAKSIAKDWARKVREEKKNAKDWQAKYEQLLEEKNNAEEEVREMKRQRDADRRSFGEFRNMMTHAFASHNFKNKADRDFYIEYFTNETKKFLAVDASETDPADAAAGSLSTSQSEADAEEEKRKLLMRNNIIMIEAAMKKGAKTKAQLGEELMHRLMPHSKKAINKAEEEGLLLKNYAMYKKNQDTPEERVEVVKVHQEDVDDEGNFSYLIKKIEGTFPMGNTEKQTVSTRLTPIEQ